MDQIAVIIPVHNRRDVTLHCLRQMQDILKKGFEIETIVVDDGSTDGTSEAIVQEYPDTTILKGDGKLWWAGGVNKGFRYALEKEFDFIFLINDDTEFAPDTLQILYDTIEKNRKAVCSSVMLDKENDILGAGVKIVGPFKIVKSIIEGKLLSSHTGKILKADTLSTKSVLLPTNIVKDVGYFDYDRLPHNYADFDYFIGVKDKGYDLLVNMDSRVYSDRSNSDFHDLIVTNNLRDVLKTFKDVKYGNHIRTLYNYATKRERFIIGQIGFFYRLIPYTVWLFLKVILPKKLLSRLITMKRAAKQSDTQKIIGDKIERK